MKNVLCIGAGYVGGPSMAVLADRCRSKKVTVVDVDAAKIRAWKGSKLPIFEPGLDKIVRRTGGKNLFFFTDIPGGIERADIIFVCVNTPTKAFGYGEGYAAKRRVTVTIIRATGLVLSGWLESGRKPLRVCSWRRRSMRGLPIGRAATVLPRPLPPPPGRFFRLSARGAPYRP